MRWQEYDERLRRLHGFIAKAYSENTRIKKALEADVKANELMTELTKELKKSE